MSAGDGVRLQKAASAIKSLRARVQELEASRALPVAIVGMGCRFPGAGDPAAYWQLLRDGRSGVREIPGDRWDVDAYHDHEPGVPGRMTCREGGFLDDVSGFDAAFFGISPREARRLDPQQRLLLEVGWEALESAAINPLGLAGSRTGVFVGIAEAEYLQVMRRSGDEPEMYDLTGTAASVASGRLSYHLGLCGPNIALDTACSSSLVAVHLATASLRSRESDLALAGGVNLMLAPETFVAFCNGGALAPDGRCKTFDARADGYGRGEGCGVVVLKRLNDAMADGDRVLAVIRGSAVNHDGRTNGLTAPAGLAQRAAIRAALTDAGVAPADVAYVETHGTGTQLGDPIEAHALGAVFGERRMPLLIGATKTNIGHLEAAAGVAGLIKAVLVLQHGELPPNLHFEVPNPLVDWAAMALRVPTEPVSLPAEPLIAGVSSFGFSGTNAHVVVAAAPAREPRLESAARPHHLLTLSARTSEALSALARRHASALVGGDAPLGDVCFTARIGRASFQHRLAVVATSRAECAVSLERLAAGKRSPHASKGDAEQPPRIAFLFAGQGSQYAGMGQGLYASQPAYRSAIDRCDRTLREAGLLDRSLVDVLASGDSLDRTAVAQPALFALECATAHLWRSWGVEPDVVLGHSTGEYAAACVAGTLSLENGVLLVARRARLIEAATADGATAAVFGGAERVADMLAPFPNVGIAAVNGPRETVIAGDARAVRKACSALKRGGFDSRPLTIPHAPHSPLVEPILEEFEQFASSFAFELPRIALVSNLTGRRVDTVDATHWRRHLREPVRFADAMATVEAERCQVLLEVGPQPVLQLLGRQCWNGGDVRWLTSLWEGHDDRAQMLQCVGELYVAGADIHWKALDGDHAHRKVDLPTYPFERSRHWVTDLRGPASPAQPPAREPDAASAVLPAAPASTRPASLADELIERVAGYLETEPARVSPLRTFVELGADSLLLARLVQDIEDAYGVEVGIGQLFDDLDTIAALAAHIAGRGAAPPPPATTAALVRGRDQFRAAPRVAPPVSDLDPVRRRHLDELLARYAERTAGSLARAKDERAHRVDTRMRSLRPETRAVAYPIVGERAEGGRFWDVDGNEYVDIAMGVGVLLCGHNPAFIGDAVAEQVRRGIQTGPICDLADEVATTICEMTGMERMFFGVTGTSAVRGALRVAQSATGRSRFAMFSGSYHGQDDRVLAIPDMAGDPTSSLPSAPGISPAAASDALILTYGSDRALELVEAHAAELAAVLVEPVQSRNPEHQPALFLRELRALTRRLEVPLIFDEVITGFRVHPGGAQALFGVQADIVAYGKCIGGGHPISIVAGAARYMDHVDGGAWIAHPPGRPARETTYIGSTFEMHPTALAATRAMLRHLRSEGPALQEGLDARTEALADELNQFFADDCVPIRVLRFSSLFRFAWKGNASYAYQPLEIEVFHLHLIAHGIYIWEGRTCFLSTAHTAADLEAIVAAAKHAAAAMRAGGFLPPTPARGLGGENASPGAAPPPAASVSGVEYALPVGDEQQALLALRRMADPDAADWTVSEHVRLEGRLRLDALRAAVRSLVRRHEALRTVFAADGLQQLIRSHVDAGVQLVELTGLDETPPGDVVDLWLARELARPFDLVRGPLLRVFAVKLRDDVHHLVLIAHHLVCDGWSMALMLEQLAALYSAQCENGAPEIGSAVQYRAFVAHEDARSSSPSMATHQAYWTDRFPTGLPRAALRTGPVAAVPTGHRGARCRATLEPELCAAVADAGRARGCTLFMTLLAAHSLAIHELTGHPDLVVGTPTSGRSFKGAEAIVGYCTHLLAIRTGVTTTTTIATLLGTVRENVLEAFAHQDLSFARMCAAAAPGDADPFPLDTIFNLDRSLPCPELHGLNAAFRRVPAAFALVPLRLDAIVVDDALWLDCDYDTDLVDKPFAVEFLATFVAIAEHLVCDAARPAADPQGGAIDVAPASDHG